MMSTTQPTVSVCLPNLNTVKYLPERLDSILNQTYSDFELIISDNYSDDGSWELLQNYASDPRIILFQTPRAGMYANWNECLKRARGEYVYIATSDDTCKPEIFEKMVKALEKYKKINSPIDESFNLSRSVDIAVCDFDFIDEKSKIIDPPPRGTARDFYGDWIRKNHVRSGFLEFIVHTCVDVSWTTITAVLFRRSLLDKVGYFRTDCEAFADKFWAMRSGFFSDSVYVPEKLATWRHHPEQESSSAGTALNRRMYAIAEELLDSCRSMMPEAWLADVDWKGKLLWGVRSQYLISYRLYRGVWRRDKRAFVSGAFRAMFQEPRYFLERLMSRCLWDTEECQDGHEYIRNLIEEWEVPWPPEKLD